MVLLRVILAISIFIIFNANVGYPLFLVLLNKILKPKDNEKKTAYLPNVTYMIVAHNEEKVIEKKLLNSLEVDYPKDKIEILVASDNSTDKTELIVQEFAKHHQDRKIRLYSTEKHMGKTNAQNEAQKTVDSEILVMTDANAMVRKDSVRELVSSFVSNNISYVCGKLIYTNSDEIGTGSSEAAYWNMDLNMRNIESKLQTITAGNGALYACRNSEYVDFDPIYCHDSAMPYYYAKRGKRAIFNPDAIAFERTGDSDKEEFKRKVRMNRIILTMLKWGMQSLNVFRYKWFSVFFFGHRTCRYLLWAAHILLLLNSIILGVCGEWFWSIASICQGIAICIAILSNVTDRKNKLMRLIGYYGMTIWAQIVGVYRIISGKAKPTWESAEGTR